MFLERVGGHARANMLYDPSHFVLQCLDYLDYIDIYADRIRMFHVKDAEFNPTGRQGVYGGYQSWIDRAGRFRSLGDGQVDFGAIFSKLAAMDFDGWAVVEWECCLKHPEDGAREGAAFVRDHIIRVTDKAFDDFAGPEPTRRPTGACWEFRAARRWRSKVPAKGRRRVPSGSAWSAAAATLSSAQSTASRPGSMAATNSWRAPCPRRRRRRARPVATSGLAEDRIYDDFDAMAKREARLKDGIEAVSIVTPNHMHYPAAMAFLKRGIHVICDKPLTSTMADARKLAKAVASSDALFVLTHNYTGYPMVRQAREMVRSGELGDIRLVQAEYPQDWLTEKVEDTGQKQADWRTDPARSGQGGSTGDIGTHAFNLAQLRHRPAARQPVRRSRQLRRRPPARRQRARPAAVQGRRQGHAVVEPGRARKRERPAPARLRHKGRDRVGAGEPELPVVHAASASRSAC